MLIAKLVTDAAGLEAARGEWSALLERAACPEPTMGPAWLLPWWRVYGPHDGRALRAVLFHEGARLVGVAPLLLRTHRYRFGVAFRRLELLASGEADGEEIGSDYIGVLAERGAEAEVAGALADALVAGAVGPWDELSLRAMSAEGATPLRLAEALRRHGVDATVEVTDASPYVPLPATWDAYLEALPSSRRYLVRRSLRDFDAWAKGTARFERAESRADVARALETLKALHRERWSGTERTGVFVHPRYCAFHDDAALELFDAGALDLYTLSAHGRPIAAAYNLVAGGNVRFYQSGRAMDLPKNVRAGIVLHAHAIRAAIALGRREYDFLAGASRYKSDLALAVRSVVALRAARPSLVEAARRATDLVVDHARLVRDNLLQVARGSSPRPTTATPPQGADAE